MLKFDLNSAGISDLVDRVDAAATRALNQSLQDAWEAVLDSTPSHTGFLKASWFARVNGSPGTHPDQPSKVQKRRLANLRPFRRLPKTGSRRNVFNEKFGLGAAGLEVGKDAFAPSGAGPRAVTKRNIGVRQTVEFVNNAVYAEDVNVLIDFETLATARLRNIFQKRFSRRLKAELRKRPR